MSVKAKTKPKKPRRPLHRITTIVLTDVLTARGWKWRLLRGTTVLWSKPASGTGAISRDAAIAAARGYLIKHGYSTLLDRTGARVTTDPPKFRPGAHFNVKKKRS